MSTCLSCRRPWTGRGLHCDTCRGGGLEAASAESQPKPRAAEVSAEAKAVAKALQPLEDDVRMAIRRWCEARGAVLVIDAEQGYRPDRCKHCGEPTGTGTTRIIRGFPDLVVFWPPPRPVWWIECKSSTGRQTEHQKAFQQRCEEAGQVYLLARSVDDVIEFEANGRAA